MFAEEKVVSSRSTGRPFQGLATFSGHPVFTNNGRETQAKPRKPELVIPMTRSSASKAGIHREAKLCHATLCRATF